MFGLSQLTYLSTSPNFFIQHFHLQFTFTSIHLSEFVSIDIIFHQISLMLQILLSIDFTKIWPKIFPFFRSAFRMPTSRSYPRHFVQFCEKRKRKRKAFYLLAMSQGFPRVTKGYQRLPKLKGY